MSINKEAIANRLAQITKLNRGSLTPENVIADAKNKTSPLHDSFEWDDSEAAHQYRLAQARELIRSVRIEIITTERIVTTVKYIRDPEKPGDEQGYVEVASIRDDKTLARSALRRELGQAEANMQRAAAIAIALNLESEFDEMLDRIRKLRERIDVDKVA